MVPKKTVVFRSVLGDPIFMYFDQRKKSASGFVRSLQVDYSSEVLSYYWKLIAFGVLSSSEAYQCLRGSLSDIKASKWEHFNYLIDSGFCCLKDFLIDYDLCVEKELVPANTIALKSEVLAFNE